MVAAGTGSAARKARSVKARLTAAQRVAVVAEARSWANTPYHSHARLKGVGVDCAQLLHAVYVSCGLVPDFEPGHYPEQFGLHRSEERFLGIVLERATEIDQAAALPGDCVLFRFGRCYSHGGILVDPDRLIHAAMREKRVCYANLSNAELADRQPRFFTIGD